MNYRWMPALGMFDIGRDEIVFKGASHPSTNPAHPEPLAAVGILLCDQEMSNGRVEARVMFAEVIGRPVCELILGYDVATQGQVTAGLGGSGALFSIREWVTEPAAGGSPGQRTGRWNELVMGGDRSNLKPEEQYRIAAELRGSRVRLEVNGVKVAEATVGAVATQPRQVGVFCLGEGDVAIADFVATVDRPKAFVVMQFSSPYNDVYAHVIKDACESLNIEAVRADEIYGASAIIIKDVIEQIATSQVVIADISPSNPNVYFEVGYALALNKPIILLAQKREADAPLPFDVSSFRVLFYDDSIGGKPRLEEGLIKHLRQILGRDPSGVTHTSPGGPDNEIWMARHRREENRRSAEAPEPSRVLYREHEGKREARIVRGFEGGFEWTIQDLDAKAVIEAGKSPTIEQAKIDAEKAAGTTPISKWKSRA